MMGLSETFPLTWEGIALQVVCSILGQPTC